MSKLDLSKPEVGSLIRVFEYGCGSEPLQNLELAVEQMFRRHELWNQIVEIDNEIRTRMEVLLRADLLEDELATRRKELAAIRARTVKLNEEDEGSAARRDNREQLKLAAQASRKALESVKRARKSNADTNRVVLRELDAERRKRINKAVRTSELYWCNRSEVLRHYETARGRAVRQGRRLRTRDWDGTGRVCVYFQAGLDVGRVFGGNGRLQIDPVSKDAWRSTSRAERRRLARTYVRIRVGANADKSPIWFELPLTMHRPLPEEGVIRSAVIVRERVGLQFRYRLLLTLRLPKPKATVQTVASVGIDFGWRTTPGGLRVAYWAGEDGSSGELLLSQADVAAFVQIQSLESKIVAAYERARCSLGSRGHMFPTASGVGEFISVASACVSAQQLCKLFEKHKEDLSGTDQYLFGLLCAWHKEHVHLWTWQANLRDQLIRRRRERYRLFTADLVSRFSRAFLNDISLARKVMKPLFSARYLAAERQHRFIAALSTLYQTIEQTFEREGGIALRIHVVNATMMCHGCGAIDKWNPASMITHTCSNCGSTWDQDYNAALNVLRAGLLSLTSNSTISRGSDSPTSSARPAAKVSK